MRRNAIRFTFRFVLLIALALFAGCGSLPGYAPEECAPVSPVLYDVMACDAPLIVCADVSIDVAEYVGVAVGWPDGPVLNCADGSVIDCTEEIEELVETHC